MNFISLYFNETFKFDAIRIDMTLDNFPPEVILLDAVGTLFGVRDSVGEVYANFASQFGVNAEPQALNSAFFKAFEASPPMAFPGVDPNQIPQLEFEWWQKIAIETFEAVGVLEEFTDFSQFFQDLYQHFATAEPWFVYPDVKPALKRWRKRNILLGVLSNFDSRLYSVLDALELTQFFTSVTISTEVGAAKPDFKIFNWILAECYYCVLPEDICHIGDSFQADYQGAKAAGLEAILINRNSSKKIAPLECKTLEDVPF